MVQTTANIINGIEIIPTICNNTNTCGFASSGAAKNHGNGSETANQIIAKSMMVLTLFFFLESNTLAQSMDDKLIWDFFILRTRRHLGPKQRL
jgi:hypothetical protein